MVNCFSQNVFMGVWGGVAFDTFFIKILIEMPQSSLGLHVVSDSFVKWFPIWVSFSIQSGHMISNIPHILYQMFGRAP